MKFSKIAALLSIASVAAFATPSQASGFTNNLIVNSGAEAGVGSTTGGVVVVPNWITTGNATAVVYNAPGGFPRSTDIGPLARGNNFFAGGENNGASSLSQVINLGTYSDSINTGRTQYDLSAWLGGYTSQNDNAVLSVTFRNASNATLGLSALNPVFAAERNFQTGLRLHDTTGFIPVGTENVLISLDLRRTEGSYNDGYADNLSFKVSPVPEPETWAMLVAGIAFLAFARAKKRSHA
jgi:PEP-CTERM motif